MCLLETIRDPVQIRDLDPAELEALAAELREKMIDTVRSTGGHLASSLGAVAFALVTRAALGVSGLRALRRRPSGVDAA